jgi:hypothetical protein
VIVDMAACLQIDDRSGDPQLTRRQIPDPIRRQVPGIGNTSMPSPLPSVRASVA